MSNESNVTGLSLRFFHQCDVRWVSALTSPALCTIGTEGTQTKIRHVACTPFYAGRGRNGVGLAARRIDPTMSDWKCLDGFRIRYPGAMPVGRMSDGTRRHSGRGLARRTDYFAILQGEIVQQWYPDPAVRAAWTASAGCSAHWACIASVTIAPSAGECGRPRTVTSETSRQNSGATKGRATTPGCVTQRRGMNARPRPAAAMARIQSSRSLS